MKNFINWISLLVSGFTLGNGLLLILIIIDGTLYDSIIYHYSNCLTWYVLFYLIPILIGFIVSFLLKKKVLPQRLRIVIWIVAIVELSGLISGSILNKNYWGYLQKRPIVFKEIKKADIVSTCALVSNVDSIGIKPFFILTDTTKSLDRLFGRKDSYYGLTDRIFMVFQDRAHINGHLYDFPNIYNNPQTKPEKDLLNSISTQIFNSDLINTGKYRENNLNQLTGYVTEFITTDNKKYAFACLKGSEVSNDHYPFYEFLFSDTNGQIRLLEEQRIYTDIAGIEGLEFANVFPYFSMVLTICGLILIGLIEILYRLIKRLKKSINNNAL